VPWLRIKKEAICTSWSLHVSGRKLHSFLTSALRGGEWPASRFGRITVVVWASGSYRIGSWVGPDLVRKLQRRNESLPRLRLHGAMSAFSTCVHSVAKWCPVCFIKRVFIASCVLLKWVLLTMKVKVVLRLWLLFCILLKVACRWFGQLVFPIFWTYHSGVQAPLWYCFTTLSTTTLCSKCYIISLASRWLL